MNSSNVINTKDVGEEHFVVVESEVSMCYLGSADFKYFLIIILPTITDLRINNNY